MNTRFIPTLLGLAAAAIGVATAWLPCACMGAQTKTAETARPALDLLAGPLESSWKYFSEDPQSRLADTWQLREGVLSCRGVPKGYLYLERDLADFILRLEWRWPPGKKPGNGGVLVRITGPHKIWPRSLEAQLNAGQAGDFWGLDGFPLDGPAERKRTATHPQFGQLVNLKRTAGLEKPAGEWNSYEIRAEGETVILKVNGQEVNRASRCATAPGKICLTAEGDAIEFRHVQLIPEHTRSDAQGPR